MSDRRGLGRRLADLSVWALSMLEEKKDVHRRLSATRVAVAAFSGVFLWRVVFPVTWPDVVLAFVILFALPITKKLDEAKTSEMMAVLEKAVEK